MKGHQRLAQTPCPADADGALTPGKLLFAPAACSPWQQIKLFSPASRRGSFFSEPPTTFPEPPTIRFSLLALGALLFSISAFAQPPRYHGDSKPLRIVIETIDHSEQRYLMAAAGRSILTAR